MQYVAADIHRHDNDNKDNLILADSSSEYVVSKHISNMTTAKITAQMKIWFNLLGWSHTLSTKNSPHFNKDFTAFFENHNRAHNITSPTHTDKGNMQTVIRSAKQLLIRCKLEEEDYQTALANM